MKNHFHTGIETAVILTLEVAILFHVFRVIGLKMAKRGGGFGKAGEAIGGFFTFGGTT